MKAPVAAGDTVLAAAIQFEPRSGDVPASLSRSEELVREAGAAGAKLIVLPEFFSTGMALVPSITQAVLDADGAATAMLQRLARDYDAIVGGSFLCTGGREPRNAFVPAGPGVVLGRHDKDLPTMWEHCFYVGGGDDALIDAGARFGVALCWAFIRRPTAQHSRGRVDCVLSGSGLVERSGAPAALGDPLCRGVETRATPSTASRRWRGSSERR